MNKLIVLFLIGFISHSSVQAQFGYGKLEDVQQIQKVPLLVVLLSSNEKKVKKLSKKKNGNLEQYLADIDSYNTAVKNAFQNSWNFSTDIKYITSEELKEYNSKQNKDKYAYFRQLIDVGDIGNVFDHKGAITTYNYAIYLTGKRKPVYSHMYSTILPNEADFKLISQQIQGYLKARESLKTKEKSRKEILAEIKANAPLLKQKTLLIEEENLSKSVLQSIGELYKYPYKIVSRDEIDQAIISDAKDMAYLRIIPVGQVSENSGILKISNLIFMQYVINAENGEYLAYVTPSPLRLPGLAGALLNDNNDKMKKNDLLEIIEAIENGETQKF
ncbi:MAG TPA: hypothetical protein VK941_10870 [Gillisia sp.]|nr:hypothetical protein [Gillisia sp.]